MQVLSKTAGEALHALAVAERALTSAIDTQRGLCDALSDLPRGALVRFAGGEWGHVRTSIGSVVVVWLDTGRERIGTADMLTDVIV